MLSPTEGLSLFGGDTWLSCHTDVLSADFILTIRCCKWQPIYPFKCIVHKTYFLKQKPSDPPSRNKISKQPTTHILHCSQSSLWGRHGVLHLKQRHMKRCRARIRKKNHSRWLFEFHFSKSMILICSRCRFYFNHHGYNADLKSDLWSKRKEDATFREKSLNDFAHIPCKDTEDFPPPQGNKFLLKLLVKGPGYLPRYVASPRKANSAWTRA